MPPTIEDIKAAERRLDAGESTAAVARSSALKRTALYKYLKMRTDTGFITINRRGAKPAIPINVENDLVAWIAAMQRAGWPVEHYEVILKASQILSYHMGIPRTVGRGWFKRFEKRHHDLSSQEGLHGICVVHTWCPAWNCSSSTQTQTQVCLTIIKLHWSLNLLWI